MIPMIPNASECINRNTFDRYHNWYHNFFVMIPTTLLWYRTSVAFLKFATLLLSYDTDIQLLLTPLISKPLVTLDTAHIITANTFIKHQYPSIRTFLKRKFAKSYDTNDTERLWMHQPQYAWSVSEQFSMTQSRTRIL